MPTLTIDGKEVTVEAGTTVLQACEEVGVEIPRFCYHERLSIAGNCRMCLVEMEKAPKPIASCAMPAGDGMVIHTNSAKVKKAREGVMEFLLINHPLDCPICDQGGECDLQDQAVAFGRASNRFDDNKRAVKDKNMGPLIETTMTRCIHCMRCVRFSEEVAGVETLGALGRGEHTEVTTYLEKMLDSELSGNVIDLCPVGALTSKPYAFTARSWELTKTPSIDVMDALGSNIRIDSRGSAVMRILPRLHEDVNEEWLSDKSRFIFDGLKKARLDQPYIRKDGKLVPANWREAFAAIKQVSHGLLGSEVAGFVGDLADMEAIFALKGLLTGLGSEQIECRQDGSKLEATTRASYLFNGGLNAVEDADLILLVGVNPRRDAAVFNARLRRAVRHGATKIARLAAPVDLTYPVEELGDKPQILNDILNGAHGLSERLKKAVKPLLILGSDAVNRPDGAAILKMVHDLALSHFARENWHGYAFLHRAASRVGALDLGAVSKQGLEGLLEKAQTGNLKLVFNLGSDELDMAALAKSFHVYIGSHGDAGAKAADVILPSAAFTEKSGTYINTEGRVQRTQKAVSTPGEAREDWTILRALSDVILDKSLPYDTLAELRAAMAAALPQLKILDMIAEMPWGSFGETGTMTSTAFSYEGQSFYQTNPIARASQILKDVMIARGETADEEATGTHG